MKKRITVEQIWWLNHLEKFQNPDMVPEPLSVCIADYKQQVIPNFIRCGAIPKSKLIDGKEYWGSCRNTSIAVWRADMECFEYERYKLGLTYIDHINHFEDDDNYDLFVPIKLL